MLSKYQSIILLVLISVMIFSSACSHNSIELSLVDTAKAQELKQLSSQETDKTQIEEYKRYETKIKEFSKDRNLEELNRLWQSLHLHWKFAKDKNYYILLENICGNLISYDWADNKRYLYANQCSKAILVDADKVPIEIELSTLHILQSVREYSTGVVSPEDWNSDRAERVQFLSHLWWRVQKNIDPSFDPHNPQNRPTQPFLLSQSPPKDENSSLYKEYENVRNQYTAKVHRFNEQTILHRIDERLSAFVEKFLIGMYSVLPYNESELRKNLTEFNLPNETNERVLNAVKDTMTKENNMK